MLSNSESSDGGHAPRSGATSRPANSVARYLSCEDVALDLDAANKGQVFAEVAQRAEHRHGLARQTVYEGLCAREAYQSTALGLGVAIPHARIGGLQEPIAMFVRTRHPILFDAPDGKPVARVLVLLVPEDSTEYYLDLLADTAQLFCDRPFRQQLADAPDPAAVCRLFAEGPRR